MRYDQKQFTQQGLNLFTNALSQKQSITIDKVIMDNLPTSNLSNLALLTLDDFANAQSFSANYTKVDNNMLTVDSVISNQGFTNSYSANEVGLVGHTEGSNDETLIAILVASDPFILPAQQNDETPLHLIPNVTIQLANNDMGQVPVDTAQDAYVPQNRLDELVSQHNYVKLTDADSRYVKQDDFNREVNDAVNNKADKSDLNNLQSNINNDVQPQLNQKANQSDLNNTNGVVANKADQSDVNQKFNQTESDVQEKANQSDLSTTNNNVSNNTQSIDNLQSNKVDKQIVHNLITNTSFSSTDYFEGCIDTVYLIAGQTYWFSANVNNNNSNMGLYISINNSQGQDEYANSGPNISPNLESYNNQIFSMSYVPSTTQNYYINVQGDGQTYSLQGCTLTQTNSYVPFEATDSVTNDTLLTPMSYANNLQNKTNDLSNTMNQQFSQATAHSDQNLSNVQGQIASIKANAWRELTPINGASGISLCKPDFSNNRATVINTGEGISGSMAFQNDANDFNFIQEVNSTSDNYSYTMVSGNKIGRETNIAAGFGSPIGLPTEIIFQIQPK